MAVGHPQRFTLHVLLAGIDLGVGPQLEGQRPPAGTSADGHHQARPIRSGGLHGLQPDGARTQHGDAVGWAGLHQLDRIDRDGRGLAQGRLLETQLVKGVQV